MVHCLRQQRKKADGLPYYCLADFICPEEEKKEDFLGMFAVTAGIGIEKWITFYEDQHDDYSSIMMKALADRLAEALAEYLHEKVRMEYWGYSTQKLDNQSLIEEKYQGIRPAPGYPSCPDHTEKDTIWEVLNVKDSTGIYLTESKAMYPVSSVSGYYFSHPDSKYFGLGNIQKDQAVEYSIRKKMETKDVERWLASHLCYDI